MLLAHPYLTRLINTQSINKIEADRSFQSIYSYSAVGVNDFHDVYDLKSSPFRLWVIALLESASLKLKESLRLDKIHIVSVGSGNLLQEVLTLIALSSHFEHIVLDCIDPINDNLPRRGIAKEFIDILQSAGVEHHLCVDLQFGETFIAREFIFQQIINSQNLNGNYKKKIEIRFCSDVKKYIERTKQSNQKPMMGFEMDTISQYQNWFGQPKYREIFIPSNATERIFSEVMERNGYWFNTHLEMADAPDNTAPLDTMNNQSIYNLNCSFRTPDLYHSNYNIVLSAHQSRAGDSRIQFDFQRDIISLYEKLYLSINGYAIDKICRCVTKFIDGQFDFLQVSNEVEPNESKISLTNPKIEKQKNQLDEKRPIRGSSPLFFKPYKQRRDEFADESSEEFESLKEKEIQNIDKELDILSISQTGNPLSISINKYPDLRDSLLLGKFQIEHAFIILNEREGNNSSRTQVDVLVTRPQSSLQQATRGASSSYEHYSAFTAIKSNSAFEDYKAEQILIINEKLNLISIAETNQAFNISVRDYPDMLSALINNEMTVYEVYEILKVTIREDYEVAPLLKNNFLKELILKKDFQEVNKYDLPYRNSSVEYPSLAVCACDPIYDPKYSPLRMLAVAVLEAKAIQIKNETGTKKIHLVSLGSGLLLQEALTAIALSNHFEEIIFDCVDSMYSALPIKSIQYDFLKMLKKNASDHRLFIDPALDMCPFALSFLVDCPLDNIEEYGNKIVFRFISSPEKYKEGIFNSSKRPDIGFDIDSFAPYKTDPDTLCLGSPSNKYNWIEGIKNVLNKGYCWLNINEKPHSSALFQSVNNLDQNMKGNIYEFTLSDPAKNIRHSMDIALLGPKMNGHYSAAAKLVAWSCNLFGDNNTHILINEYTSSEIVHAANQIVRGVLDSRLVLMIGNQIISDDVSKDSVQSANKVCHFSEQAKTVIDQGMPNDQFFADLIDEVLTRAVKRSEKGKSKLTK